MGEIPFGRLRAGARLHCAPLGITESLWRGLPSIRVLRHDRLCTRQGSLPVEGERWSGRRYILDTGHRSVTGGASSTTLTARLLASTDRLTVRGHGEP